MAGLDVLLKGAAMEEGGTARIYGREKRREKALFNSRGSPYIDGDTLTAWNTNLISKIL